MGIVLRFFRGISFWSIVFAMLLITLFDVRIGDFMSTALSNTPPISYVCAIFLFSFVVYPLLLIIQSMKASIPVYLNVLMYVGIDLCMPYYGLKLKGLFHYFKKDADKTGFWADAISYIFAIIFTIIWWGYFVFLTRSIFNSENIIREKILSADGGTRMIYAIVSVAVYILIAFVYRLTNRAVTRLYIKVEEEKERKQKEKAKGTRAQRYFERHPDQVPVGCSACGGPYPECRASCNLYDD